MNFSTVYKRLLSISFFTEVLLFIYVESQCDSAQPLTIDVEATSGRLRFPVTGEYGTNQVCRWLLTSSRNAQILYQLLDIQIDCTDKLDVFDAPSLSPPSESITNVPHLVDMEITHPGICRVSDLATEGSAMENKVDSLCTSNSPFSKSIAVTKGQNLLLVFRSDSKATAGKDLGFTIEYVSTSGTDCPSNAPKQLQVGKEEIALTSPSFPLKYPLSTKCSWILTPETEGATLVAKVTFLDVEKDGKTGKCFDTLKIQTESSGESVLCQNDVFFPSREFKGEKISVTFESDDEQREHGFVLIVQEIGFDVGLIIFSHVLLVQEIGRDKTTAPTTGTGTASLSGSTQEDTSENSNADLRDTLSVFVIFALLYGFISAF